MSDTIKTWGISVEERYEVQVVRPLDPDRCFGWRGPLTPKGYALIYDGDRNVKAHTWVWKRVHGAVPDGYDVDHRCRNRSCTNLRHLRLLTTQENRGAANRAKTHCKHGHAYSPENTRLLPPQKAGWAPRRQCRTCERDRRRR